MLLLLLQFLAASALTGLIWFVQIVHYPLFSDLHPDNFCAYEARNMRKTTFVVVPLMITELAISIVIPLIYSGWIKNLGWLGLVLLAMIWLSTRLLQVPSHAKLRFRHDSAEIRRLVCTNWVRTVGWTLRCVLAGAMVWIYAKNG
jgi:hypothetical protein